MKFPIDQTPYPKDPRSKPIDAKTPDGGYVYVRDTNGIVYILPDGPHLHPKVLGGGQAAKHAGDLTVNNGKIIDVTNLLGTFQFDDEAGLKEVAEQLRKQGLSVELGAVRFFPGDGSAPIILE